MSLVGSRVKIIYDVLFNKYTIYRVLALGSVACCSWRVLWPIHTRQAVGNGARPLYMAIELGKWVVLVLRPTLRHMFIESGGPG